MKFESRLFVYFFVVIFLITAKDNLVFVKAVQNRLTNTNTFKKCIESKNSICLSLKTEVVGVNRQNQDHQNQQTVFNFELPITKCKPEDCHYCCLSNNKCGKKSQCKSSM